MLSFFLTAFSAYYIDQISYRNIWFLWECRNCDKEKRGFFYYLYIIYFLWDISSPNFWWEIFRRLCVLSLPDSRETLQQCEIWAFDEKYSFYRNLEVLSKRPFLLLYQVNPFGIFNWLSNLCFDLQTGIFNHLLALYFQCCQFSIFNRYKVETMIIFLLRRVCPETKALNCKLSTMRGPTKCEGYFKNNCTNFYFLIQVFVVLLRWRRISS